MNKRDVEVIAECVRMAARLAAIPTQSQHTDGPAAVRTLAEFLASALVARVSGSRFDRAAFLAACDRSVELKQ